MSNRFRIATRGLAAAVLAGSTLTAAATIIATPATVVDVISHAAAGDTVKLAPGNYDPFALKQHRWSQPVIIDATAATLRSVRLNDISGLTWRGGTFDGGEAERYGLNVQFSDHIVVDSVKFSHFLRNGLNIGSVSDGRVVNNSFFDSGSDGIDIALSRRIVVDHNRCTDFHPTPGAHPDCIQLWSRPTAPPTADIVISNNQAIGDMQGFTMFNHVRNGVDDGGFDRITIENNLARVTNYNGIAVSACRQCIVRHNRVESLPNPAYPRTRAWIKVDTSGGTISCDNLAVSFPNDPGRGRCRDGE